MLVNETISKLREMRLSTMARVFEQQLETQSHIDLSFEDRFGIMVDAEWGSRKSHRLQELIRRANYAIPGACLEDIEYRADRQLNKTRILSLGTCEYIQDCRNIIILGATGCGKTYLACAFGVAANRNFLTARYIRLPELLHELALARSEGYYQKVIKQYKQVRLLILDEWLLLPLKDSEARDLLEIIEARHKRTSTIFCSQFDVPGWHDKIGEPTLADAICDRIVHDSRVITIAGKESMRKLKGIRDEN